MKNKFRASFSVLEQWSQGNWDRATQMYFKLTDFTNEYIKAGRQWHKDWEAEINKTGCYPEVFGGKKIKNFDTEIKVEKKLSDWLELVGVIDLWLPDQKTIVDWKSGMTPSTQYARGYQPKVYQILFSEAKRFEIYHFNQYTHKVDMSIVHLTKKTMDEGLNWVITWGSEMHEYLTTNNLYERFTNETNLRQSEGDT